MGQHVGEDRPPSMSAAELITQLNAEIEQHQNRFFDSIQLLETSMSNFEAGLANFERNVQCIAADAIRMCETTQGV